MSGMGMDMDQRPRRSSSASAGGEKGGLKERMVRAREQLDDLVEHTAGQFRKITVGLWVGPRLKCRGLLVVERWVLFFARQAAPKDRFPCRAYVGQHAPATYLPEIVTRLHTTVRGQDMDPVATCRGRGGKDVAAPAESRSYLDPRGCGERTKRPQQNQAKHARTLLC